MTRGQIVNIGRIIRAGLEQIALWIGGIHLPVPDRTLEGAVAGAAFVGRGLISYRKRIGSIAGLRLLYSTASVARAWAALRVLFMKTYCPCSFCSSRIWKMYRTEI